MRRNFSHRLSTVAACAAVLFCSQAQAALLTFNLGWSGQSLGNTAEATAVMVVDDALLPNPGSTGANGGSALFSDIGIVSFDMVVSGASSGNGSFSILDFASVAWDTGIFGLDLSTQLLGQATGGAAWGTSDGASGDFNVFTIDGLSPTGTFFFELTTSGGLGDSMVLSNFAPVPVPAALPLLLSALGGLGFLRRQTKRG